MRLNKQELLALASQTSQNFDREGVLVLMEKQESFFRRSEGCSVRWFRLRGNLLFYLKGPEIWHELMGVIILGQHDIKVQNQDENGHWPFLLIWENGLCYRLATFYESERDLWLRSIQVAPYDNLKSQIAILSDRLNGIKPIIDISNYRKLKGILTDINEVPLCELALSCDNLLCDSYGRAPSSVIVIYVKFSNRVCVKYGTTEIIESCSNPCFSRTILFRASDCLTGDVLVKIVVYDVRERVTETVVIMGFTAFRLSTIQEAQRLRVALLNQESKTVGFVTINSWSLEPSYIGTSPSHTSDKNNIEIPQKVLCHRRSQSLPPRLGLNLKFPSYGNLLKMNFVNSHQVTYRFHSGLGGDITVYEIMAEPKFCYTLPIQLLDIFIRRENELLEELLSVGNICDFWQKKQLEFVNIHASLLKHYCHSKRCMLRCDKVHFKQSSKKEDPSLEFAPVNLHLQRIWVYNDTLNKTGFHDIITAGAFAVHTHRAEKNGGLIRLVQQVKNINDTKGAMIAATASKIQAEYDNVMVVRNLRDKLVNDVERSMISLQANQTQDVLSLIQEIKSKLKTLLTMWDSKAIEDSLSSVGWSKNSDDDDQELCNAFGQLNLHTDPVDYCVQPSSSCNSKESSGTLIVPTFSASVPNICPKSSEKKRETIKNLHFENDYFKSERGERNSFNNSLVSVCLPIKSKINDSEPFECEGNSLKSEFKCSASLEQVSYRNLMENLSGKEKSKEGKQTDSDSIVFVAKLDSDVRQKNLSTIEAVRSKVDKSVNSYILAVTSLVEAIPVKDDSFELAKDLIDAIKSSTDDFCRWLRIAHAALRLRWEVPQWTRENAALQSRRDTCFSQALTTVTSGLICWLCSLPGDVIVKILSSGLGPLCSFEGLLSLYGTEKSMWGDMVVAVEDLHTVQFVLNKVGHSNTAQPHVSGTRGALTVYVPISDSLYSKFQSKEHLKFTITAVFFNIGINDKATLAEETGDAMPQYHSNNDNMDRINKYYHKYKKVFTSDYIAVNKASSRTKPLEEVMENLKIAVQKKTQKNVEVLHLAALATRLLNGIRFTSCKSAKDRTGMSVTLEQCSILTSEYHLAEHEIRKALNVMRSEGCRRENTHKNIGINKYAFTKKQVASLPQQYRPPPGTYGSTQT